MNNNKSIFNKLIIDGTILEISNLKYPSERIYYYGKLMNKNKRNTYILNRKYNLMKIEIFCDSSIINWSVRRNISDDEYHNNETGLSFVTEKWSNGRELLTMYIFKYFLCDIHNKDIDDSVTNYIFKYINAPKNPKFKNYILKDESIKFDNLYTKLEVNKIKNVTSNSTINYSLKIVKHDEYINKDRLKPFQIINSFGPLVNDIIHGNGNKIIFY